MQHQEEAVWFLNCICHWSQWEGFAMSGPKCHEHTWLYDCEVRVHSLRSDSDKWVGTWGTVQLCLCVSVSLCPSAVCPYVCVSCMPALACQLWQLCEFSFSSRSLVFGTLSLLLVRTQGKIRCRSYTLNLRSVRSVRAASAQGPQLSSGSSYSLPTDCSSPLPHNNLSPVSLFTSLAANC